MWLVVGDGSQTEKRNVLLVGEASMAVILSSRHLVNV
jgi:hypothetical protein